jgi:putative transposase
MSAVTELASDVGTSAACQALRMPRASYYWQRRKVSAPVVAFPRPSPARALRPAEREAVLSHLHEERFQDRSPAAVYATLLDEGEYHCSIRSERSSDQYYSPDRSPQRRNVVRDFCA